MASWLDSYVREFQKLPSLCRIYDEQGRLVTGSAVRDVENPFIKFPLSGWLPGWTVHLFVEDITLDSAADKQAAVYLWAGLLVVGLILACGGLTARMIGRQIRMNRLKNDFIATVTHELKTPLSSMRLLVDTLLEGGYAEPTQCREYLEMICRENHRLSRMIDSFLTFSRMERGKQVFEMASVPPAEIAAAAAEAVQAKFQDKKCRFSVTVEAGRASIRADKDAMVTVLVNLLDNACKYSGDNKEISLRVFRQDPCVCFSVADNGIGMTRRQIKRIFDKFYQADNSLARRAEGCGLGLSIVKYILDAHKAEITVESSPGKGSVFTVRIPTE
jgi:signal transduction histidine kinase